MARNVPALIPVRDRRCFSRSPLLHMSGPCHWCPSNLRNWIKGSRRVFGLHQTFTLTRGTRLNNPTTMLNTQWNRLLWHRNAETSQIIKRKFFNQADNNSNANLNLERCLSKLQLRILLSLTTFKIYGE